MLRQPQLPDQLAAVEALQAAVTRQIGELDRRHPSPTLYVIVEQGLDPKLQRFAQRRLATHRHAVLFEGTPEQHLAQLSPWLVALPGEPDPFLLSQFCIASQTYAAVTWLWSPLALEALADHLRAFMSGVLWNEDNREMEGEVLVRLTDARAFPGFIETLRPAQREELLRPIVAWALWDRQLNWRQWEGLGDVEVFDPKPLRIDLAQLAQMDRHSQTDKILSLLDDQYGQDAAGGNAVWDGLLRHPLDVRYRSAGMLIEQARRLGYASDQDLMMFISVAYLVDPRFYEQPFVRAEIERGVRSGQSLATTLTSLPQEARRQLTES